MFCPSIRNLLPAALPVIWRTSALPTRARRSSRSVVENCVVFCHISERFAAACLWPCRSFLLPVGTCFYLGKMVGHGSVCSKRFVFLSYRVSCAAPNAATCVYSKLGSEIRLHRNRVMNHSQHACVQRYVCASNVCDCLHITCCHPAHLLSLSLCSVLSRFNSFPPSPPTLLS
jgi:hypothetical protein